MEGTVDEVVFFVVVMVVFLLLLRGGADLVNELLVELQVLFVVVVRGSADVAHKRPLALLGASDDVAGSFGIAHDRFLVGLLVMFASSLSIL